MSNQHEIIEKIIIFARALKRVHFCVSVSASRAPSSHRIPIAPVADRPSIDHIRHASLKLADLVLYARTFGKDLTFYEEIFSGNKELTINTINRWGIDSNLLSYDILLERFNPKHKYTNKK